MDEIEKLQYENLRENFNKLRDNVLGEKYYNMAMDVYDADRITCEDIMQSYKDIKDERFFYRRLVLVLDILLVLAIGLLIFKTFF